MSDMPESVSYYDHQEQMTREERHTNRWRIFAWVMFEYVSGNVDDVTTPTPTINVIDGSLSINRIA